MFGGEDPSIQNLVPSDIVFRRNHFYKPLEWLNGDQAGQWSVKNLFELKNAQNLVVDSNIFEHNWIGQQRGFGFTLLPRDQFGKSPWSVVQNATFTNNLIRHMAGGVSVAGWDTTYPSKQLNNITFSNNLLYDIGNSSAATWGPSTDLDVGHAILIENDTDRVTFDHNTAFHTTAVSYSSYLANTNFVFTNNVMSHNYCGSGNNCGMSGANEAPGMPTITSYFTIPYAISNNLFYAGDENNQYTYPADNDWTASSASFNMDYTVATPAAPGGSWGINSSVLANTAGVAQYCTSNGVDCSSDPRNRSFSLAVTPGSKTVGLGSSASYTVNVVPANDFSDPVNLTVSGLPGWATASFSPSSLAGSGSSVLTVKAGTAASGGPYTLAITGQDAITPAVPPQIATVTLAVSVPAGDFSISGSPASQTVVQGKSAGYTVTLSSLNGFTGTVNLSASGVPAGASASFNPASVTGSGTSTLTVTTGTAAPGSYTVTVTGTSGSLVHTTSVKLVVNGPSPDFTISAAPSSLTVHRSSDTTVTVTIGSVNGFDGAVKLGVSGVPSRSSASFNPSTVTGSGSSMLTISVNRKSNTGTYNLAIKGTSGSLSHSTNITLIVQ